MQPQVWRWQWGPFILYCVACFFVGLFAGLLQAPGVVPLGFGALLGGFAAWWRWFEAQEG